MIALIFSIAFSTYLVLLFKLFKRLNIDSVQAIVVNYMTCVATGLMVSGKAPSMQFTHESWFPYTLFLGLCFFAVFNMMAYMAANIGVTLTSVASKLSMVIPVTAAVFLYDQQLTAVKIAGLVLAIAAVYLTSVTKEKNEKGIHVRGLFLALVIFILSGLNDSVVNYAAERFLRADEFDIFNIFIFSSAAITGLLTLLFRRLIFAKKIQWKAIAGGIALGIPNYFSLLFLLKALTIPGWESSVIFPINNMGILLLTAAGGVLLFREKLSIINWAGIITGLAAIGLMIGGVA